MSSVSCPSCDGRGRQGQVSCMTCKGSGQMEMCQLSYRGPNNSACGSFATHKCMRCGAQVCDYHYEHVTMRGSGRCRDCAEELARRRGLID